MFLTVVGSTALPNVRTRLTLLAWPVAPLVGTDAVTPNVPVTGVPLTLVVKLLVNGVTRFSSVSRKPLTLMSYRVDGAVFPVGVQVRVCWSAPRVTVPGKVVLVPWTVTVMEVLLTVSASSTSLATAVTTVFTGVFVAPLGGLIWVTVGGVVSEPVAVTK